MSTLGDEESIVSAPIRRLVAHFPCGSANHQIRMCHRTNRRSTEMVMNVAGLEDTAKVGLVRSTGTQPLDCRLLVGEDFKIGIRKVVGVKRLVRQLRDCFFDFNGVQGFIPPNVTN